MQTSLKSKSGYSSSDVVQNIFRYKTEIGEISISEQGGQIVSLCFSKRADPQIDIETQESEVLKEAHAQLKAYFKGKLREFSLPLLPRGTEFQTSVWKALCEIPYGVTVSYKHIAAAVDKPKAFRAVGNANNKNPIPILIPCHRVIASDGKLCGYGGGISIKEKLLKIEGVIF